MERRARTREGHLSDLIQERSATSSIVSRQPPLSGPLGATGRPEFLQKLPMSKHHTSTRDWPFFPVGDSSADSLSAGRPWWSDQNHPRAPLGNARSSLLVSL